MTPHRARRENFKILGDFELRSDILIMRMSAKDYALGVAAFFDAGHAWADWQRKRLDSAVGEG
jgi:hypothetical protein